MEAAERTYRKPGAGECTGKGFASRPCSTLTSGNPLSHHSSPTGDHHLFLWGLYHGRCQTGPRLSGLTGLRVGHSGSGLMGPPHLRHPLLSLSLGPETGASWVPQVEKTWESLSKSQPGSNEVAIPRGTLMELPLLHPRLKGLRTASGLATQTIRATSHWALESTCPFHLPALHDPFPCLKRGLPASCSPGFAEAMQCLARSSQRLVKVSAQWAEQSSRVCPPCLPSQPTQVGPPQAPACFAAVSPFPGVTHFPSPQPPLDILSPKPLPWSFPEPQCLQHTALQGGRPGWAAPLRGAVGFRAWRR